MNKEVRVGVAAVVLREGRILLGERIGSHGAHTWATQVDILKWVRASKNVLGVKH